MTLAACTVVARSAISCKLRRGVESAFLCGLRMVKGAEGAPERVAADASAGLTTLRAAVGFRPVYTPFARKQVTALGPGSTFGAIIVVKTV